MNAVYKNFHHALLWSAIESVGYHVILLAHQIMLFRVMGSSAYGLIGAVFSFIYLSIALFNFGLDDSLAPFFSLSMKSKQHFKKILIPQLLPEISILFLYSISVVLWGPYLTASLHAAIPRELLYVIGAIIISEGMKKTIKTLLSLAFAYKKTASVELATINFYIVIVWIAYWLGIPLTLSVLLIPLLCASTAGLLTLGYTLYHLYKSLPESDDAPIVSTITRRIIKNRIFSYLVQLNHQFFSGNFLVPLFALHFGLSQAGILKLISHIVHTIGTIFNKIFGPTTFALLAHHKNMDLAEKRKAFYLATGFIHQALYCLFIFFFINYKKVLLHLSSVEGMTPYWPLIILFIVIHFSEHFFIIYEKFYITEEKTEYIFLLNCFTTILMYGLLSHSCALSPLVILGGIILIRITSFILLHSVSFYLWEIIPDFTFRWFYVLASTAFSAFIFVIA